MYLFDTHVHTQETSSCGKVKAQEGVNLYKKAGYSGIVITDHYYKQYFDNLPYNNWNDKIHRYLTGYLSAVEEGKQIGLNVFLGMEIRFADSPYDYLVYGIDEKFLMDNPELYKLGLEGFRQYVEDKDILIFQAHPYRPGLTAADPSLLDGVEVFNGNPRHNSRNDLALAFAKSNNLLMLSGSDFHQVEDLARGGIEVSEEIDDAKGLLEVIKGNELIKLLAS
jgi:predicted metal-dependent phosphoesterase TrpH